MIKSIALVLVMATGSFYPVISPLIGALGTFVTGSDTSANVLFGGLQVEAAKSLGTSPYWLAAANTCGATAGMNNSDYIFAINKDEKASIFKVAHYGIVGDIYEIVPKLIEEIKGNKGE